MAVYLSKSKGGTKCIWGGLKGEPIFYRPLQVNQVHNWSILVDALESLTMESIESRQRFSMDL